MRGEERLSLPDVLGSQVQSKDNPAFVTPEVLCERLREAQLRDKETGPILQQLEAQKNPKAFHKRLTGQAKQKGPLHPPVTETMRVAEDGVLEAQVLLHQGEAWVPYLPDQPMPFTAPDVSWRKLGIR